MALRMASNDLRENKSTLRQGTLIQSQSKMIRFSEYMHGVCGVSLALCLLTIFSLFPQHLHSTRLSSFLSSCMLRFHLIPLSWALFLVSHFRHMYRIYRVATPASIELLHLGDHQLVGRLLFFFGTYSNLL